MYHHYNTRLNYKYLKYSSLSTFKLEEKNAVNQSPIFSSFFSFRNYRIYVCLLFILRIGAINDEEYLLKTNIINVATISPVTPVAKVTSHPPEIDKPKIAAFVAGVAAIGEGKKGFMVMTQSKMFDLDDQSMMGIPDWVKRIWIDVGADWQVLKYAHLCC